MQLFSSVIKTTPFRIKKTFCFLVFSIFANLPFISFPQDNCDNYLTAFQQWGSWGYKNKATGAVVVYPQYDFADYLFADGVTKITKYKKSGLINCYGTEVVSCKYDDIIWNEVTHSYIDENGFVKVKQKSNVGLITRNGQEITPCKYDDIGFFSDSTAIVKASGLLGCINSEGKEVIPCIYSEIKKDDACPDLLVVSKGGKMGAFNKSGKEIVSAMYDYLITDKFGLRIRLNQKSGVMGMTGKEIIPCEYDSIYPFYDSLALVKRESKYGFFNSSGLQILPCEYEAVLWNSKKHVYFPGGRVTVKKDGKYGIVDKKGKQLVDCRYEWEFHLPVYSEYTDVSMGGLKGIIDREGKEILPCQYEEITWDYDPEKNVNVPSDLEGRKFFNVMVQEKWGVVDDQNNFVIPAKYDEIDCFINGITAASISGKWGYINLHDSIIVPFNYDYCQSFDNNLAIAGFYEVDKNSDQTIDRFGLINSKGKKVLPYEYSISFIKSENVYVFSNSNNLIGIADSLGKIIVKPEYNFTPYWDSWKTEGAIKALGKSTGKYGYFSKNGKLILPFEYSDVGNFSEGMVVIRKEFKWGYADDRGKEIIPFKYDEAYPFSDGLALVRLNGLYGFIDKKGKEIIPLQYNSASSFFKGYAKVQVDETNYGLIDKTGTTIIPAVQENILFNNILNSHFTEDMAVVQKNGLFGYYNNHGNEAISCRYSWADFFSCGRALVKDTSGKYHYILKNGNNAFPSKFSKANAFYKGLAVVKQDKYFQMIDTLGSVATTFSYDEIKPFYDGPAAVRLGKLWGFVDDTGKEIITPKFDKAASFKNEEAQVEIDGEIFRINIRGEIVGQGVK